jgi:recyclin-1
VKRNVLASFKDVLLLPVTIVPLTVNALVTGGTQAVNGLSMLNPQRWANQGATAVPTAAAKDGEASEVVFAIPETGDVNEKAVQSGWDTEETGECPTPPGWISYTFTDRMGSHLVN